MDKSFTTSTQFLPYLWKVPVTTRTFASLAEPSYVDNYTDPCPVFQHRPKLFAWSQAKVACRSISFSLKEFTSRTEQDNFLLLVKQSSELFAVDAIFLNLQLSSTSQASQKVSDLCCKSHVFFSKVLTMTSADMSGISVSETDVYLVKSSCFSPVMEQLLLWKLVLPNISENECKTSLHITESYLFSVSLFIFKDKKNVLLTGEPNSFHQCSSRTRNISATFPEFK